MDKKKIFINERTEIYVNNDLAIYSFSLISQIFKSTEVSYFSILNTLKKIKKILLENSYIINNINISIQVQDEYDYEKKERIGFKTIATISYVASFLNKSNSDEIVRIQNSIMSLKTDKNQNVFLNSIDYKLSTQLREESELKVVENSISLAIKKLNLVAKSLYPKNEEIRITKTNVRTGYSMYSFSPHLQRYESTNIISEGKSKIEGIIDIEARIFL